MRVRHAYFSERIETVEYDTFKDVFKAMEKMKTC